MSYFNETMEVEEFKIDDDSNSQNIKIKTRFHLFFNRNYCKSPRGLVRIVIIVLLTPLWLSALFINKEENKYYQDWASYELTRVSYISVTVVGQVISLVVYFIYTFSIDRINSFMKLYFPCLVKIKKNLSILFFRFNAITENKANFLLLIAIM